MGIRRCSLPVLAVIALAMAACSSDELQAPPEPAEGTLTVDASTGWAYASLADETPVAVTDPTTSTGWDIGFNATRVMLNGGAAGPAGVRGYCICQNALSTDEQIVAMTAEAELADLEAVAVADIPPAESFETDALVTAIRGWFGGTGAAATAETGKAWLLRLEDGASYAKLRIVSLASPTASNAGQVTLEYALQPAGDQPFGPIQSITLDASSPTSLDLNTGSTAPAEGTWDLRLEGFTLRLNSGESGAGSAGAAETTEDFDAITTANVDSRAYQVDGFGGVFTSHPWYRYNLTGENRIHPTFDVFLIQRGDEVYKVQLIDYYSTTGEPRRITFRYAKLTD
jgi:hypothetical protein